MGNVTRRNLFTSAKRMLFTIATGVTGRQLLSGKEAFSLNGTAAPLKGVSHLIVKKGTSYSVWRGTDAYRGHPRGMMAMQLTRDGVEQARVFWDDRFERWRAAVMLEPFWVSELFRSRDLAIFAVSDELAARRDGKVGRIINSWRREVE